MYVTEDMITAMAEHYGQPSTADFAFAVAPEEYRRIRDSQKNGRRHDFTVYAIKGGRVIVIAKPFYPPGLYRAPSGGAGPGEGLSEGIAREMWEETGCRVDLERFLLRTHVRFVLGDRGGPLAASDGSDGSAIDWYSHVFQARYATGEFLFTDRREIREVRLAAPEEFAAFSKIMRRTEIGGLHYRAALHEAVADLLVL